MAVSSPILQVGTGTLTATLGTERSARCPEADPRLRIGGRELKRFDRHFYVPVIGRRRTIEQPQVDARIACAGGRYVRGIGVGP